MDVVISDSTEAFIHTASDWCKTNIERVQAKSVFLPAGRTPVSLYEVWEKERPEYLQKLRLLQIDDVLTGEKKDVFKKFFLSHLSGFQTQFLPIAQASELADLAILGLGLNGHVAFHEPGLDASFFSGCVPLSELTCQNLEVPNGTWGITYGAGAFNQTKGVLMMVQGESKKEILARLLDGDASLPAAALLKHSNLTILADRQAMGG